MPVHYWGPAAQARREGRRGKDWTGQVLAGVSILVLLEVSQRLIAEMEEK